MILNDNSFYQIIYIFDISDYKKLDKEIQKSIVEAQKLKKQIDKGGLCSL